MTGNDAFATYCAGAAARFSVKDGRTVDCGLWTVDCGLWIADYGLLTRYNTTSRFWQYFGLEGKFKTG